MLTNLPNWSQRFDITEGADTFTVREQVFIVFTIVPYNFNFRIIFLTVQNTEKQLIRTEKIRN